jgi:hypothetical protein
MAQMLFRRLQLYLPVDEFCVVKQFLSYLVMVLQQRLRKKETSRKYANITTGTMNFYLSVCEVCSTKEAKKSATVIVR